MTDSARRGFALVTVLWLLVGALSIGLTVVVAGRESVIAAGNRMALTRAAWRAHGCIERTRAVIGESLKNAAERNPWSGLDTLTLIVPGQEGSECDIDLTPTGSRLDINAADRDMLMALLTAIDVLRPTSDSLADALLDWRDADDEPRPFGAEASSYGAGSGTSPRNGPLADLRELSFVRGWQAHGGLDVLLTTEPGRIVLDRAPAAVLAALPGIGSEALSRLLERRDRREPTTDLIALGAELSPAARGAMLAEYADLARLTTPEPDAWILRARSRDGSPAVTAFEEVRLVRAGPRAAIVRQRTGVE